MRPIVLIGLPGSGKSAVGKELSKRRGWQFVDLDAQIEKETGRTIAEIFEAEGEGRFREIETAQLEKTAAAGAMIVIAAGGGIVEREANRKLLKTSCLTIYLELPVAEAARRIWTDEVKPVSQPADMRGGRGRPLFKGAADEDEVKKRLARLLERREPFYRSADVVVPSGESSAGEVAAAIERAVDSLTRT